MRTAEDGKPAEIVITGAARRAVPLNEAQQAEATKVARRLRGELEGLFQLLPADARSGVGLARHLGVDRGTGTRFANVCRKPMQELEILRQIPGIKGLEQVLEAFERLEYDKGVIAGARRAVEAFEQLIQDHGGSQSRLSDKIAAARAGTSGSIDATREDQGLALRKRLYEAAADVLGQQLDLRTNVMVFRPNPEKPNRMDQAMVRGVQGYRARPDAPPYVIKSFGKNDEPDQATGERRGGKVYTTLTGEEAKGLGAGTVLEEFTSDPIPLVTARGTGREMLMTIDPHRASDGSPLEFVTALELLGEWDLPIYDDPPRHEISSFIKSPCANLIFDVFLHRSMAAQCLPPSLKVYQTTPGLFDYVEGRWYDQMPQTARLQLLEASPQSLHSPMSPRHAEMFDVFFHRLGWAMDDFVGYRCEVQYPVWTGFYCMIFDYSSARESQSSPE